ncbi:hypothetical protein HPB49_007710 [Dermacentor silvarum]|uniref:Uncharacterized protein n=1 Tax=Dermacentor silvarum TaxID=543639 RepID=A0ACB8CQL9_DERSI|nr:hypothetical protein HPB49_007710 [Dermacentor silvarum]
MMSHPLGKTTLHRGRMSSPDKVASSRNRPPTAARKSVASRKGRAIRSTSSKAPFVDDDGGALAKGSTQGAVSAIGSSKLSASRLNRTRRSRGTSSGEATDTSSTSPSSTTPKTGCGDHTAPAYGSHIPSDSSMGQTSRRLRTAAGILFALVVVSLLSLNLARTLRTRKQDSQPPVSPSVMGVFSRWGIVGHHECGNTTRNILRQNGTVGDVAVAATLCMCVALPNRCGIGGGLYAIYYSGQAQQAIVVDGHETAPAAANWKTYEGTGHTLNAMYVGVPGQMAALETILNVTGTAVPWPNLFADAIALARDGFPISPELAAIIASKPEIGSSALRYTSLRLPVSLSNRLKQSDRNVKCGARSDIFWRDGRPLKAGETLVQRALAATLHGLSQRKASVYEGPLAAVLAGDLHAEGGLLTEKDLASYRVNVTMPVAFALPKGHTLLAPRPPAGGLYLGLVLGVMGHFVHPDGSLTDDSSTAHRFVESLKFAFSRRNVLADPQFADIDGIVTEATSPETVATIARIINSRMGPSAEPSYYGSPFHGSLGAGTAHFGFLAPNGDAIVVSSSLNSWFGSMVLSRSTGVIFNDVIRDFDLPYEVDRYNLSKTPRNQVSERVLVLYCIFSTNTRTILVSPGHRPLSTLTPSLVVRDGYGVAMAVSGSGGGRTISGIAQVVMRELWMDQTLKRAVDWGRLHHQFIPDTLYAESTVSREIVDTLKFLGHKTEVQGTWPSDVMAMARRFGEGNSGDRIYATYDFRRQTNNFVDGE